MIYSHQSVLIEEIIHYLQPKPSQSFIDCTIGGGGHTIALAQRLEPWGKILGIDLDPLAIKVTQENTKNLRVELKLTRGNFKNLKTIATSQGFTKVNGILLDLGLSSGQLQDQERGFSFLAEGKLDMRFSPEFKQTAEEILNTWSEKDLIRIFKEFGEEKLAQPIVKAIIKNRKEELLTTPQQLVAIVIQVYKKHYRQKSKVNPATKIFQALRIVVNDELENLKQVLPEAVALLAKGGRLAVISYHSLEDRIVKEFFKKASQDCICLPTMPVCQCHHKKSIKIITKKPVTPQADELLKNPRSRSAKLRIAQKI